MEEWIRDIKNDTPKGAETGIAVTEHTQAQKFMPGPNHYMLT